MPTVVSNGIRIHYEERGSGDPLILIMGLGAPGSRWEDHAASYEKHFRCILMDNRGAGESDRPLGPYTTKMMADDTASLMTGVGYRKCQDCWHLNGQRHRSRTGALLPEKGSQSGPCQLLVAVRQIHPNCF